ncbi:MAG: glycosyl transferase family 1, partial [Bacteroidota bacterium]
VLAISPLRGDAAKILEETRAGALFLPEEEEGLCAFLLEKYQAWRKGNLLGNTGDTERFSRLRITEKLASLLDGFFHH